MVEVAKEEKEFFKGIEPIGQRVIIKRDTFSSSGKIIVKEGAGKYKPIGVVVAAGPECTNIKVGDIVGWSSTTMLEVIFVDELKENSNTDGNYVCTSETYLVYKKK